MNLDDVDTLSQLKADLESLEKSILLLDDMTLLPLSSISVSFYPENYRDMQYCNATYDIFFFDDMKKAFKAKLERTKEMLKAYGVEI